MDEQQRRLAEELLFTGEEQPSFAKKLYFGLFDGQRVFPFPQPSQQERERVEQFIEKFKAFADQSINADWIDRHAEIPATVIEGLGKLGLLGLTIPEQYGGLGFSQYGYCRVMEWVSRYCGATALFVNAHQSIGLKALLLFGTEEQRSKWLPKLSRGEELAAFSLTEPNAGSDASAVETQAIYNPDKKTYTITGRKQWTTNGSIAKVLTVMAKTELETAKGKQQKITAFLVTPDMPGFKVLAAGLEKVGMRGSKTANLEFNQVEVPESHILGPLGDGLKVCLTVLDYGRVTFGATCTGAAKLLLEKATHHATQRIQFKQPLAAFPLVKKKLATMAALIYAMESTTYLTAGLVDSGASEFMLEAAILKVFNSDSLWTILYDTMQIYGGRSFFTDEPLERMMRDARLNMIGEGSNEVLRAFIGVVGMRDVGLQLKGMMDGAKDTLKNPFENLKWVKDAGLYLRDRLILPDVPVKSPLLTAEAKRLGRSVRNFGFAVTRLLSKHREAVLDKQLDLDRIATSAIALYTTTAVLSRLDADLTRFNGDAKALGADVDVAKLYCRQALDLLDQSLLGLFSDNTDTQIESISDQLTGRQS